jgi:hypothetical protein
MPLEQRILGQDLYYNRHLAVCGTGVVIRSVVIKYSQTWLYKRGDLLKEVQFIWNLLWKDKKGVTFWYRWPHGQVFCTMLLHIEEWHCQSKFKASFSRISCAFSYVTFNEIPNRVGALMVNMLTSSPVDRSHELWSG